MTNHGTVDQIWQGHSKIDSTSEVKVQASSPQWLHFYTLDLPSAKLFPGNPRLRGSTSCPYTLVPQSLGPWKILRFVLGYDPGEQHRIDPVGLSAPAFPDIKVPSAIALEKPSGLACEQPLA